MAVDRAVQGMDGVHVSLGVEDPAQLEAVEHKGTATVAPAAARHGLDRISYLTGSLVRVQYGSKIPEHRAKLAAEEHDPGRGRSVHVLSTDLLHQHAAPSRPGPYDRRARPPTPSAASGVRRGLRRAGRPGVRDAGRRRLRSSTSTVQRSSPFGQALGIYRQIVAPDKRLVTIPLPVMSAMDRLFMGGELAPNLQIMRLLARLDERGDPTAANEAARGADHNGRGLVPRAGRGPLRERPARMIALRYASVLLAGLLAGGDLTSRRTADFLAPPRLPHAAQVKAEKPMYRGFAAIDPS